MTKINRLYQKQNLIPVKYSLVAAQKKFKRVEVLLRSWLTFAPMASI